MDDKGAISEKFNVETIQQEICRLAKAGNVKALNDMGDKLNVIHPTYGTTVLHELVSEGNVAAVQALIDAHADLDIPCFINGQTPLFGAIGDCSPRPKPELYDSRAIEKEENFQDRLVRTQAILKALLDAGANPNISNSRSTALIDAVLARNHDAVSWLLAAGARPETTGRILPNYGDQPPLFYAAVYKRDTKMAKILIAAGADVNRTDALGRTILDLAKTELGQGKKEVVAVLTEEGALTGAKVNRQQKRKVTPG